MRTNVAISSIEHYHGRLKLDKGAQQLLVLSVMRLGRCYTGQELARATGLVPGTISARLFELRESGEVVRETERQVCPISHVSVFVHRKLPKQLELV